MNGRRTRTPRSKLVAAERACAHSRSIIQVSHAVCVCVCGVRMYVCVCVFKCYVYDYNLQAARRGAYKKSKKSGRAAEDSAHHMYALRPRGFRENMSATRAHRLVIQFK